MWIQRLRSSPPASSNKTRVAGSSLSRPAAAQPADLAPTTMKSASIASCCVTIASLSRLCRRQVFGEIFFRRDQAADDPELVGLPAEDVDRLTVLFEPVGVEIRAHDGFGLFELGIEPGRDIREIALRRRKLVVATDKGVGRVAGIPLARFPYLTRRN